MVDGLFVGEAPRRRSDGFWRREDDADGGGLPRMALDDSDDPDRRSHRFRGRDRPDVQARGPGPANHAAVWNFPGHRRDRFATLWIADHSLVRFTVSIIEYARQSHASSADRARRDLPAGHR